MDHQEALDLQDLEETQVRQETLDLQVNQACRVKPVTLALLDRVVPQDLPDSKELEVIQDQEVK